METEAENENYSSIFSVSSEQNETQIISNNITIF